MQASGLQLYYFIKKRLWHRYFAVNFVKFLRTPFLHNTSGGLLLKKENRKNSRNKSKQRTFYFSFSWKEEVYLWPSQRHMIIVWEHSSRLRTVYYFCKALHHRCLTGFRINLWKDLSLMIPKMSTPTEKSPLESDLF